MRWREEEKSFVGFRVCVKILSSSSSLHLFIRSCHGAGASSQTFFFFFLSSFSLHGFSPFSLLFLPLPFSLLLFSLFLLFLFSRLSLLHSQVYFFFYSFFLLSKGTITLIHSCCIRLQPVSYATNGMSKFTVTIVYYEAIKGIGL